MDDNIRHIQAEFSDFKDNARRRVRNIRLISICWYVYWFSIYIWFFGCYYLYDIF